MNINIKGTHVEVTPSLKSYVQDKIGSLGKYIQVTEAKIELDRDQHHKSGLVFRAEATIYVGGKIMRAEERAEEMYAAVDLLIPKIREQISKFKDKKQSLRRRGARLAKSL